LHLLEVGQGSPTILLEAGLMSTVLSWSDLQRSLAESFRVVSYDRAGLGWSELGPMPRTADRIVEELHTLLERAAIPPPYILVGHSFGGLTMPLFAARFSDEVRVNWYWKGRGWVLQDSIPIKIVGGRAEGFRGYGFKSNYKPGAWKVQVETTDGREIGRVYFGLEAVPASPRSFEIDVE